MHHFDLNAGFIRFAHNDRDRHLKIETSQKAQGGCSVRGTRFRSRMMSARVRGSQRPSKAGTSPPTLTVVPAPSPWRAQRKDFPDL